MNGDKGDLSRGEKLFISISQGEKFKKDIQEIRTGFEISPGAFVHRKDITNWYSQYHPMFGPQDKWNLFIEKIETTLKRNALPVNSWWRNRLITFILSGDKINFLPKLHYFQKPFVELINHHVGRDGSYNDIRIYERATKEDVLELIDKKWNQIKPSYREGTKKKIRKQDTKDMEINAEAVHLMSMSKKDLGIQGTIKEIEIGKRLSQKYGKKITSDAVKARAHRTRNQKG